MHARVFLMAGEASSDAIGAKLMIALRHEYCGCLQFTGIGGERMKAAGLHSLFPMSDLNVMGFAELLPALPRLGLRLRQTITAARQESPNLVVGIDSKGFCLRVLGALAADRRANPNASNASARSPALVQYVAPSAWAFRDAPDRAAKLVGVVDELLALLPFEEQLFTNAGVRCTFVGHPALEDHDDEELGPLAPPFVSDNVDQPVQDGAALCLLPGSRPQEVASNLPHMLAAAERIVADPSSGVSELLLPASPAVRALVESHLATSSSGTACITLAPRVHVCSDAERFAAYRRSRLAIACSGTVNIELARSGVPQVAVYRSTYLTSLVVRHILRPSIQHATLPNIINTGSWCSQQAGGHAAPVGDPLRTGEHAGEVRGLIPELLFEDCTASSITNAALRLLHDPEEAASQVATSERALATLVAARDADGLPVPSARLAARALLRYLPR